MNKKLFELKYIPIIISREKKELSTYFMTKWFWSFLIMKTWKRWDLEQLVENYIKKLKLSSEDESLWKCLEFRMILQPVQKSSHHSWRTSQNLSQISDRANLNFVVSISFLGSHIQIVRYLWISFINPQFLHDFFSFK